MLGLEENKVLTQTGPGTPMGNLLRHFWVPALLADELPAPDCPPVRVRLMSEDLIAFRDSNGQIGLVDAHCPHRLADLFFGRNEECGLRCVYHGWKFDVNGECVDMPNEPAESNFKSKIRTTAYKCEEFGGVIWAYLGPPEDTTPQLPQLEWARVPAGHRYISKRLQRCNFVQGVEGGIDTIHSAFLHRGTARDNPRGGYTDYRTRRPDTNKWTVRRTDYGILIGARFDAEEDSYQWRFTQWLAPFFTMIPSPQGNPISGHGWVPIDDENCWVYTVTWHPDRPLTDREIMQIHSWTGIHVEVKPGTFEPVRNMENDFGIDRSLQRSFSYTGIKSIGEQDQAVQEGMGPIIDRSKEHLGTTDTAIISMRRILLRAAKALQESGTLPAEAHNGDAYRVRSLNVVLNRDLPFEQGAGELLKARV